MRRLWPIVPLVAALAVGTQHKVAGGHARRALHAPDALAAPVPDAGAKPYPGANPENGVPGRAAVAYRAGGRRVSADGGPVSRLFRTGYAGWEPSIGVTKGGTIFFAARNTNADPGVARSTDDGRTWTRSDPSAHQASLDPFIWVDRATGRVFDSDISPSVTCPPISYSDDGDNWTTTIVCGHADYQKIFGGPPPKGGAPTQGYPDVVYFCAITGGEGAGSLTFNQCSKTLDGGGSWSPTAQPSYPVRQSPPGSPPEAPNCDGAAPPGVVGVDGTVYLPRGWCGEPYIAISHDEGDSWERVRLPGKPLPYDGGGAWANDSGVAVDRDGVLYYVWAAADFHLYFTVSRDGGKTWAAPLDILPPGVARTQNPAIDVGDPGRVAISFVGSEQPKGTPEDKVTWNAYVAQSVDARDADPTFYAAPANDPATDPVWKGECGSSIRCGNMGDFYDVTVGPDGTPRGAFVDSCPGAQNECTSFGVTDPRGEAIMGQLVGGPPLVGTIAQQTPQVSLPSAAAPHTCASRRAFRIRLHEPRHGKLLRATVYVNGRRVRVVRGRRLTAPVNLRGLPKGSYRVRA